MARNKYPEQTREKILDVAEKLFLEKGYENTSIQDIINGLGGLSKGAVYHHFASKEEIFDAVGTRYNAQIIEGLRAVRDDPQLTGREKLRKLFSVSLASSDRDSVYSLSPSLLDTPKLLALEMRQIFTDSAPHYIQPVIEQGVADGSLSTPYPQEFAEVILLLANIWLNPLVLPADAAGMERRVRAFSLILEGMGIQLLDDELLSAYQRFCRLAGGTGNAGDAGGFLERKPGKELSSKNDVVIF